MNRLNGFSETYTYEPATYSDYHSMRTTIDRNTLDQTIFFLYAQKS